MDRQRTLLDVIGTLSGCLAELDRIGVGVAAAHLSACLDALATEQTAEAQVSESE